MKVIDSPQDLNKPDRVLEFTLNDGKVVKIEEIRHGRARDNTQV